MISTRDLMSWVHFFNRTVTEQILNPPQAFFHGACLVFMDSLPTDSKLHAALHQAMLEELKNILLRYGQHLEEQSVASTESVRKEQMDPLQSAKEDQMEADKQSLFGIHPFFLQIGELIIVVHGGFGVVDRGGGVSRPPPTFLCPQWPMVQ